THGRNRPRISRRLPSTRPDRPDRWKPTNCSRATAARGGEFDSGNPPRRRHFIRMTPDAATPPAAPAFFGDGVPAEIGKIEKELKKLWQEQQSTATRASRLNLVVYSSADSSLRANTAIVREITKDHAGRAILIAARAKS